MSTQRHITRRQMLGAAVAGASGVLAGTTLPGREHQTGLSANTATADPKIRGPFPILTTPFTASGAVDFDVLANQARFVDWCGCPGLIWPPSGDSVDLLTNDEKLQGMEVLAKAARGLRTALCLGVQGKDTAEMLVFANLLMTNLSETVPGGSLRGFQLYLWKKRGVFQTMVSRHYGPGSTIPASPIFSELTLTAEDIAEIEYRFEALKPYSKPGSPSFAPSREDAC